MRWAGDSKMGRQPWRAIGWTVAPTVPVWMPDAAARSCRTRRRCTTLLPGSRTCGASIVRDMRHSEVFTRGNVRGRGALRWQMTDVGVGSVNAGGDVIVEGDVVVVETGARDERWVGAVVGTHNVLRVQPIVRRSGWDTEEYFIDYSREEVDVPRGSREGSGGRATDGDGTETRVAGLVPCEWSCRQMTVDNPHGEAVE